MKKQVEKSHKAKVHIRIMQVVRRYDSLIHVRMEHANGQLPMLLVCNRKGGILQ